MTNKQKTDWEKVKEQYKDWCFYNKQHLGRMFDSEAFWDFYLKQTLQQQREEIIKEIEGIVGEDEKLHKMFWDSDVVNVEVKIRNQLRKEIRDRLLLIKTLN